jgi:hypothetical protein
MSTVLFYFMLTAAKKIVPVYIVAAIVLCIAILGMAARKVLG